jgi:hypothetical protein
MQAHRRWPRPVGVLLLLPLIGALAGSVVFTAGCDYDCGDMGGRGLLVLVLLCTPPAAVGVLVLATIGSAGRPGVRRLAHGLLVAAVLLCVLVLSGFAIAADIGALNRLTGGGPRQAVAGEDTFMIVVAVVLTAMATVAALALGAAWRKRR